MLSSFARKRLTVGGVPMAKCEICQKDTFLAKDKNHAFADFTSCIDTTEG